jgi:hypothetical protein
MSFQSIYACAPPAVFTNLNADGKLRGNTALDDPDWRVSNASSKIPWP